MNPHPDRRERAVARQQRRDARPMDEAWLQHQAMHYVERFAASAAGVRRVLEGRVRRPFARTGEDGSVVRAAIGAVIGKLEALGHVDDSRFARDLAERLRGQGHSLAALRSRLRTKGVRDDLIDALTRAADGDLELRAAWRAAQRRRLGPYCRDPARRVADRQRHLATLGRLGFSYDIARQVIHAAEPPAAC